MTYFKNFGLVEYRFGDEDESTRVLVEDLSIYVDLLDGVDDQVSIYDFYNIIDGDRPDTLAYKFYGTTDYYWTFYLMNPDLKENGWPLDRNQLDKYTLKLYDGAAFFPSRGRDMDRFAEVSKQGPWKYSIGTFAANATNYPVLTTVTSVQDSLLDNKVAVTTTSGIVEGMNISGLNITAGTTITNVDRDLNILTLSVNPEDDYEIVDGSFPTTFTVWGGNAYEVFVDSFTHDARVGDYITGTGIQNYTTITKIEGTKITLSLPTTQPFLTGSLPTWSVWGSVKLYRNWDLGFVTMKDNVRNGPQFHAVAPSITTLYIASFSSSYTGTTVIEPNVVHHYENASGEWIDPTYTSNPYSFDLTPASPNYNDPIGISAPVGTSIITNAEYLEQQNEDQRKIRVIKGSIISRLVTEFQRIVKG